MFCEKCGKKIDDNSNFCGYCGTYADSENTISEQYHTNNANNPESDARDMKSQIQSENPSFDCGVTDDIDYPQPMYKFDVQNSVDFNGYKKGTSKSLIAVVSSLSTLLFITLAFLCWNFLKKADTIDNTVQKDSMLAGNNVSGTIPQDIPNNDNYEDIIEHDSSLVSEAVDIQSEEEKPALNNSLYIGDFITFGKYEQDGNISNGSEDIQWRVLDVCDDKALIISEYILDCKTYNNEDENITWEECTLRKWLNNDFISIAFNQNEVNMIQTTSVVNLDNDKYGTYGGNNTFDKVFLMNIDETVLYFDSDYDRQCKPTSYAVDKGVDVNQNNGNCCWWLRSPGNSQQKGTDIGGVGVVHDFASVNYYGTGVRPAMWIKINN